MGKDIDVQPWDPPPEEGPWNSLLGVGLRWPIVGGGLSEWEVGAEGLEGPQGFLTSSVMARKSCCRSSAFRSILPLASLAPARFPILENLVSPSTIRRTAGPNHSCTQLPAL